MTGQRVCGCGCGQVESDVLRELIRGPFNCYQAAAIFDQAWRGEYEQEVSHA